MMREMFMLYLTLRLLYEQLSESKDKGSYEAPNFVPSSMIAFVYPLTIPLPSIKEMKDSHI